ncbi:MAG TPA: GIY-YIG nuclease family protein [Fimbriimonadaceae bacterium]|nr:GIY-YIG nuclease family protein [Fimbriimonadaceae bacterium]
MPPILVQDVVRIHEPSQFKLHLACWNGSVQPLDVFVTDREEWHNWNRWRSNKDEFNRQYIFSLIDFYPEKHRWLFGGIYEVLARGTTNQSHSYQIRSVDEFEPLVGRLKIAIVRPGRNRTFLLEKLFHRMEVTEILPDVYSGEAFPGYDNVDIPFSALETIFRTQRLDWKAALEFAKGVYLITDRSNGKRYVGSAYGTTGIWSRWQCYIFTGHGFNNELTKLISEVGIEHAKQHFQFALLEHRTMKTDDDTIIKREVHWKKVLMSRQFGFNKN